MKLKKYITEKNLVYLLIFTLVTTTIVDIYTALTSPIFFMAETNPIYILTGSILPLLLLNIVTIVWFSRNIKNSISIPKIFVFCMITIYLSAGHLFGAWSNITATKQYQENPEEFVEMVEEYDAKEKINAYMIFVGVVMVLPIVISFIAFSIAMYFYRKRQPKRDKIVNQICKLTRKLMGG